MQHQQPRQVILWSGLADDPSENDAQRAARRRAPAVVDAANSANPGRGRCGFTRGPTAPSGARRTIEAVVERDARCAGQRQLRVRAWREIHVNPAAPERPAEDGHRSAENTGSQS